jgi:IS605 OrfB family transposase
MKIRKAYKFRLKTNEQIEHKLTLFAGHTRHLWNKCLKLNLARLANKQLIMRYHELDYWVKLWKKSDEVGFLAECHSQVLQQKLRDLDSAFMSAFDKKQPLKRIPTTKKRLVDDSFRYMQGFKIDNRRVYLPKIGWLCFHKSQEIHGSAKNITVSRKAKHWYVSIQVEIEVADPKPVNSSEVAIDVGIAEFASLSNGKVYPSINIYRKQQQSLAKYQRQLSKKVKHSQNWRKQQTKIRTLHTKISNTRKDHLHKVSNDICKNHAVIYIEDLKVSNMSRSAKGDIEDPGKNVKAKSGLNKSILDQGWGEFRRQLEYKSTWNGGLVIPVAAHYTSQTCSVCRHKAKESRVNQAAFACVKCGHKENADINAAKNILAAGQVVSVCGEEALAASVKQKPLVNSNIN